MTKKFFAPVIIGIYSLIFVSAANSFAQQTRQAVSVREVTGTFRDYFSGKAKGSYSEIKISSAGKGKLKVSFDLTYPHLDASGQMSANTGTSGGIAEISGDTAVYSSTEFGQCEITIKFVKPGQIKVTQSGTDSDCGFGFNVTATGTYKKVSGAKPRFESAEKN